MRRGVDHEKIKWSSRKRELLGTEPKRSAATEAPNQKRIKDDQCTFLRVTSLLLPRLTSPRILPECEIQGKNVSAFGRKQPPRC